MESGRDKVSIPSRADCMTKLAIIESRHACSLEVLYTSLLETVLSTTETAATAAAELWTAAMLKQLIGSHSYKSCN